MIVVCGEALVDLTPVRCDGQQAFLPHPGGSPYNVAVGLARLETPVAFLGRVSTDPFGRLLRDHLHRNDVDLSLLQTGPEPTALAFVHLDAKGQPEYAFHLEGAATRSLTELPDRLPETTAALHFGSLSLVLEPGATALDTLLRREQPQRVISLDPNVRPRFIADRDAYRRRLEGWVALADVVKVSAEDLAWLDADADPEEIARAWSAAGPALVVLTDGARGALALGGFGKVGVPAEQVEVVDTVGAGDAFMAALLAWLHERKLLSRHLLATLDGDAAAQAIAVAARAAALTCTRPGADPPRRAELAPQSGRA